MGDDKLGPTGNAYSPCGWCGTAHHPIAACGHEGLRETIAILRAEVERLKKDTIRMSLLLDDINMQAFRLDSYEALRQYLTVVLDRHYNRSKEE